MYSCLDSVIQHLDAPLEELIPLAAKCGIRGIAPDRRMMEDAAYAEKIDNLRKEYDMEWGLVPTPTSFFEVGDEEFEQGLEEFKRWSNTLNKLGITRCYNHIIPSDDERDYDENFEWHVKRLKRVGEVVEGIGLNYGLECVGPHDARKCRKYPFIHTAAGIFALIHEAGTKTGIIYDTYHWFTGSGGNLDDLYYVASQVDKVVCLHVNDGVAGMRYDEQRDLVRELPMTTGVINARKFISYFQKAGFGGPVMCEPLWPTISRFESQATEKSIQELSDAYKRVFEE